MRGEGKGEGCGKDSVGYSKLHLFKSCVMVYANTSRSTAQVGGGGGESYAGTKTIAKYQHCVI